MYKKILLSGILLMGYFLTHSQSAPITIDGNFDDWTEDIIQFSDVPETVSNVDLLSFQVSNDEQFLFIKLEVDSEINLKEDDPIEHSIYLYLDTDNDAQTGFNVQPGFGSELGINFSNLTANYDVATSTTVDFTDIRLRMSPTVTSTLFEIALARDAVPDNVHPLFTGTTIKLLFKNWTNGDNMPDEGTFFTYSFDETPVEPLIPLGLNKSMPEHIRVVAYNTLFDGLLEAQRIPHFQSIIQALNPDIIAFSECYDTPSSTVENLMDSWLPLNNNEGWHVVKKGDLITASRWPVLQFWPFITRSFPVLIDLPDTYPKDLLITNAHLSCCDNNSGRQDQIDEYNSFFKQLKAGGAGLGFTEMTPFIYAGDLNLVGYAQQLDALRTGEIDNINQYGIGAPPDWDDSPITDELAIQTDKRMAYTWRNDFSAYPPGRLDFIFYSDYVMNVEKSFVLQTEVMSSERLALYDLNVDDTGKASDHFPVVADFTLNVLDQVEETGLSPHKVFPNPVDDYLTINLADGVEAELVIRDVSGKVFFRQNSVKDTLSISMQNIPAGVYFVVITEKTGKVFSHKVIKE